VDAFFAWWETDLHRTLEELRITGGEPLMSGYTWQLIDWFQHNPGRSKTRLAINSNLGMDWATVQRLLESTQGIDLDIYTSNEAIGAHAEYIRDGLDWQIWNHNVQNILMEQNSPVRAVHSMCTINALCLESLPDYLDHLLLLKKIYGRDRVNFTLNILRFPSFQSPLVLPRELRDRHRIRLITWFEMNRDNGMLHEHELNHVQRLIDYLDVVRTPHSESFDQIKFYDSAELLEINFKKYFCTIIPYKINDKANSSVSAANKTFQLLSMGLPIVAHGMPEFIQNKAIFKTNTKKNFIKAIDICFSEFYNLQTDIKDLVNQNQSKDRYNKIMSVINN
jgi:hypothetical protein